MNILPLVMNDWWWKRFYSKFHSKVFFSLFTKTLLSSKILHAPCCLWNLISFKAVNRKVKNETATKTNKVFRKQMIDFCFNSGQSAHNTGYICSKTKLGVWYNKSRLLANLITTECIVWWLSPWERKICIAENTTENVHRYNKLFFYLTYKK